MSMSLTPVEGTSSVPPHVSIEFETGVPGVSFESITVRRDGRVIRGAANTGSERSIVRDYEAPFGYRATYTADVELRQPGDVVLNEAFADFSNWSGTTADWDIEETGDTDTATTTTSDSPLLWTHGSAVSSLFTLQFSLLTIRLRDAVGQEVAAIRRTLSGDTILTAGGVSAVAVGWGAGAYFTRAGEMFRLWQNQGVGGDMISVPAVGLPIRQVEIVRDATAGPSDPETTLQGITVLDATGGVTEQTYTDTVVLYEPNPWLIHPIYPTLSMPVDKDGVAVAVDPTGEVSAPGTSRAVFAPPGRRRAVVYPLGQRMDPSWSLVVRTETLDVRDGFLDLLRDQTALLLRSPYNYCDGAWDLPDGWYSVGDAPISREVGYRPERIISMDLLPVAEPPVGIVDLTRTWGDVMLESATWMDVLNGYDTWFDVMIGNHK